MVSPSGIRLLQFLAGGIGVLRVVMNGRWDTAQVQAEWAGMESGIHEEARHGMRGDGLAVDGGDECALMAAGPHAILAAQREEMRKA